MSNFGSCPFIKNTAWLFWTALSAPKEYWIDIATIGLCFYFIRMIKKVLNLEYGYTVKVAFLLALSI